MQKYFYRKRLLVSQQTAESSLGHLGECVIGGGEDGEGIGLLNSGHQAGSLHSGDQGGEPEDNIIKTSSSSTTRIVSVSPLIGGQGGDEVSLGRQNHSVNEVNHSVARLLVSFHDTLAVDGDEALER